MTGLIKDDATADLKIMKTVVWERVKGTVSALPLPFIGRETPGGRPSIEEDEVEQALRHVREQTPEVEQPLLQSTNADRQAPCSMHQCCTTLVSAILPDALRDVVMQRGCRA